MSKRSRKNGFDRSIDYEPMKKALINDFHIQHKKFKKSGFTKRSSKALIFIIIELIQLRNGSRITEAINAFKEFTKPEVNINEKVEVKICKSDAPKYTWRISDDKTTGVRKKISPKARYRDMMFPVKWLENIDIVKLMSKIIDLNNSLLDNTLLKKSVCKYMLMHHKTNTHSLRYAFINYLLYTEKRPLNDVAKFVGHSNTNQLVKYTQQKNSDQIFELDI